MAKKKEIVTNAMRILMANKIQFEKIEYEHEGEIGENFGKEISKKTGISQEQSFKTLVLKGDKTGIIVACIPVSNELDLKKVAKVSQNKSVEMIAVKEILGLTGYIRGGVTPIGMKKKYPTFIDETSLNFDKIAISAGICGATLLIKPSDVISITDSKVYDLIK